MAETQGCLNVEGSSADESIKYVGEKHNAFSSPPILPQFPHLLPQWILFNPIQGNDLYTRYSNLQEEENRGILPGEGKNFSVQGHWCFH